MLADTMHPYPRFLRYTVLSECTSKATFIQRDCCHVGLLLWRSRTLFFEADRCSLATGRSPFSLFLLPEPRQRGSCLPITEIKQWLTHSGWWRGLAGGIKLTVTRAHSDMLSFDRICLPVCWHNVYSQQPVNSQPVWNKWN